MATSLGLHISPRVSVIICVYDVTVDTAACLSSLAGQTMFDLQIICVTTSKTLDLAAFRERDPRVLVIEAPGASLASARNAGLSVATGDYVHFLDPSDQLEPFAYTQWYQEADRARADICQCTHMHMEASTASWQPCGQVARYVTQMDLAHDGLYLVRFAYNVWDKLFRREWLGEHQLAFDDSSAASASQFSYRALVRAGSVLVVRGNWLLRHGDAMKLSGRQTEAACLSLTPAQVARITQGCSQDMASQLLRVSRSPSHPIRIAAGSLRERLRRVPPGVARTKQSSDDADAPHIERHIAYSWTHQLVWAAPPPVVVALASTYDRAEQIRETVASLMSQTDMPNRVIVWLSATSADIDSMARDLSRLYGPTIEVRLAEENWLAATVRQNPGAGVVTAADDVQYASNWLEQLHRSFLHESAPFLHCLRFRSLCPDGGWHLLTADQTCYAQPTYLNQPDIKAGALLPPGALNPEVVDALSAHEQLDVESWLWLACVLSHVKTKVVSGDAASVQKKPSPPATIATEAPKCPVVAGYPPLEQTLLSDYLLMCQLDRARRVPQGEKDAGYYASLAPDQLPAELMHRYHWRIGLNLNLDNPVTINEKIQWLKLFDTTALKTRLSDKYLVRDWVAEKIGAQYLVPLLGVWDRFEDIDFDALPDSFVLKANHGSSWNIIVYDKSDFDRSQAHAKFTEWMSTNYGYTRSLQLQYVGIQPKIIAEELLAGKEIQDYKLWCFDGVVKYVWVDVDRSTRHRRQLFDLDWNPLPIKWGYDRPDVMPDRPPELSTMIELAGVLSEGFAQVRVDLYNIGHQVYFGEMTFSSGNGYEVIEPIEFGYKLGDWTTLPPPTLFTRPQ